MVKKKKTSKEINIFDQLAVAVLILSGLNWALMGLVNFDIVTYFFGEMSQISRFIYLSTGIVAVYALLSFRRKVNLYNTN